MGKVTSRRFRYRAKLDKLNSKSDEKVALSTASPDVATVPPPPPEDCQMFQGIHIDLSQIRGFASVATKSVSGKSKKELKKTDQGVTKKERMQKRKELFLQKLEAGHRKEKSKKNKKKKKAPALLDLEPLLTCLEEPAVHPVKEAKKKTPMARPSMKIKKRLKENLKDINHFKRVLSDRGFASNPALAITQYLKDKVSAARPDLIFDE